MLHPPGRARVRDLDEKKKRMENKNLTAKFPLLPAPPEGPRLQNPPARWGLNSDETPNSGSPTLRCSL